jgi:ABC-type branched-subunit amino acid transport system substrate-binding protein
LTRALARALLVTMAVTTACRDGNTASPPPVTVAGRVETNPDPAPGDPLVIGALFASSGAQAAMDAPVLAAAQAAVTVQRAAGTAIDMLTADTRSDLATATDGARRLIEAGAAVLLVGCDGDVAVNAAQVASRRGVLVLSPCTSDTTFGPDTAGSLAFTLGPANDAQGNALAEHAVASGQPAAITVAALTSLDATQQCRAFAARYRALGGAVLAEIETNRDDTADAIATQVAKLPAPALIVECDGHERFASLVSALRARRVAAPVLGGVGADGVDGALVGVGYLTPLAVDRAAPGPTALLRAGAPPIGRALLGAAAVDVLLAAVARAGVTDGPTLATALRAGPVTTTLGSLGVDARQRLNGPPLTFVGQRLSG